MPDPNKLSKQKEVGFKILPTCGICQYAKIKGGGFGYCTKFDYHHEKHTEVKLMGIHRSGTCPEFLVRLEDNAQLIQSGFVGPNDLPEY